MGPWWQRPGLLAVAALAAAALGAWQASRVADALGFGPGAIVSRADRTPRPVERVGEGGGSPAAFSGAALVPVSVSGPGLPDPPSGPGAGDAPASEAEQEAADRLSAELGRLVSDLEFTPGLAEPLQQTVRPVPPTWRPPPDAGQRPPPVLRSVTPGTAPAAGGSRVVLRGSGLRASQVMFGAAVARILDRSPEAVTVLTPPSHPGPVIIAVTNDDGAFAFAEESFTYVR